MQCLDPHRTTWHVTFGTYGARLHGDERPTVDRQHNQRGAPYLPPDPERQAAERARMAHPPVELTPEQQRFIEDLLPELCVRGGWCYRVGAAGPDHVHVLLDIVREVHGQQARRLLKRWLTQALNEHWPRDGSWWAEDGSNKPAGDEEYLNNAFNYIAKQRTMRGWV